MKIIIISGTPGTGKTSVSRKIAKSINAEIISLNRIAISGLFNFKYDEDRKTQVVDEKVFLPHILDLINSLKEKNPDYVIIEGHFSDFIPNDYIDNAIILRCDPDILIERLSKRGYDRKKIQENIQSEILGNSANYLIQKKLSIPIYEIDTSKVKIKELARIIIDIIINNLNTEKYIVGNVDWLENLSKHERLSDFFDFKL